MEAACTACLPLSIPVQIWHVAAAGDDVWVAFQPSIVRTDNFLVEFQSMAHAIHNPFSGIVISWISIVTMDAKNEILLYIVVLIAEYVQRNNSSIRFNSSARLLQTPRPAWTLKDFNAWTWSLKEKLRNIILIRIILLNHTLCMNSYY